MNTTDSHFRSAVAFYKQGLYGEALDAIQLALCNQPDAGKLWELRGMVHHALKENADAIQALEIATTLVPLSAAGQCVLAQCYTCAGHRELAGDMLRHLMSLDHLPPPLLSLVASGLGAVGNAALALEACRRAAACEVDDGQPLYGMAHYMERLGYSLEMVASMLRRAVSIEPDRFQYAFALANVYHRLGRIDDAYEALRGFIDQQRLDKIRCPNCIRRMQAILADKGDDELREACQQRLIAIETFFKHDPHLDR